MYICLPATSHHCRLLDRLYVSYRHICYMYICKYIHVNIQMYVCTYMCMYVYICVCICMHIGVLATPHHCSGLNILYVSYMHIYSMHICIHIYMYVHMYVSKYICIHVEIYIYIYVYTYVCLFA